MFRAYVMSLGVLFFIVMIFTFVAWELGSFAAKLV